jgi:hypothetical protein
VHMAIINAGGRWIAEAAHGRRYATIRFISLYIARALPI